MKCWQLFDNYPSWSDLINSDYSSVDLASAGHFGLVNIGDWNQSLILLRIPIRVESVFLNFLLLFSSGLENYMITILVLLNGCM